MAFSKAKFKSMTVTIGKFHQATRRHIVNQRPFAFPSRGFVGHNEWTSTINSFNTELHCVPVTLSQCKSTYCQLVGTICTQTWN
jgi:hypothetical protein